MRTRVTLSLIAVVIAAVLSSGCASTARISEFDTFATAGNAYATAMDTLLTEAEQVLIDTNSQRLLWDAKLTSDAKTDAEKMEAREYLIGNLDIMDNLVQENLDAFDMVRSQVSLLAAYFAQLAGLATTDAAELFGAQLADSVTSLNSLSDGLGRSPLVTNPGAGQAAATAGGAIVKAVQAGSLEKELKLRGETIERVLKVHEELLDALKDQIKGDLALGRNREYETAVIEPLTDGTAQTKPQEWIDARRRLLAPPPLNHKISDTIGAIQKLRTAWAKLQTNSLTVADVQAVLDDLQPLIAAGEGLKKK
jgi:outer membrane murein-binding lipoprotein Lpp